jgi:hypothetical protein
MFTLVAFRSAFDLSLFNPNTRMLPHLKSPNAILGTIEDAGVDELPAREPDPIFPTDLITVLHAVRTQSFHMKRNSRFGFRRQMQRFNFESTLFQVTVRFNAPAER